MTQEESEFVDRFVADGLRLLGLNNTDAKAPVVPSLPVYNAQETSQAIAPIRIILSDNSCR